MRNLYLALLFLLTSIHVIACDADISPSDTICFDPGGTYPVTFTGSGGTAPYTFVYSVNGGAPQTITSNGTDDFAILDVPMTVIGNTQYTLISVTDANGCTVTINESSDILTVINPSYMVSGTTTVFQNSTPFPGFTFSASGGVTPYTFYYTLNGGPTQTITTAPGSSSVFLPISTAVVGVYTINAFNVQSPVTCPNIFPPVITTSTATITVIPVPMVAAGSNQTVCAGAASASVSFTASGSSGPYTYTYTVGGSTQTITGGSPISIPASTGTPGTTNYTLTGITDVYGNYQVVSATSTVTVLPAPTGNLFFGGPCDHYTISFTASGGSGPFIYNYTVNGTPMTASGGSSITVNGPSVIGPTTYTISGVSVTNAAGCTGPLSGGGTMTIYPNFSHTINVSSTSVCVNGVNPVVTFNVIGGGISYIPTFYYSVNSGPSQMVNSGLSFATVSVPTTTAGTFVYTLFGTGNMCDFGPTQSVTVVVKPLPTATISGTTSVCKNGTSPVVTFTGANGTAPYTFTYKVNGGANQTISSGAGTTATINVPTSSTGTFTYSLVSVASAAGCSQNQTGSAVITVNPLPTASISGTTTLCQNTSSPVITFTGAGSSAPYTFSYNINGGATQTVVSSGVASTATVPVPTSSSGTFTYNLLSVSGSTGCSQTQTGSATVTINPTAAASIAGTTTLCQNAASGTITFTGTNGTAPYIFTYQVNGGANQTISSGAIATATISVPTSTPGTFTYSLVSISGSNGCSQNQTGSAVITIDPAPSASISGTATLCQNDASPVITFTGTNGTAPYTFSYDVNGGAIQTISSGSGSTATLPVPTSSTGVFTYNLLSVSSANGCSQTQTGFATVSINSLPTALISGAATLCQNATSTDVTFTGANGTAPYTFSYTINGGTVQTISSGSGSMATITVPTSSTGIFTYDLLSVSAGACSQAQSGSVSITINPAPEASISGTATLCQNDASPVITFTGTNGTAPYVFSYNINGGTTQIISSGSSSTAMLNAPTNNAGVFTYNLLNVSDGSCSQNQNESAVVTILASPSATINGNSTVCEGNPAVFTLSGTPNASVSYTDGISNFTTTIPASGSISITTPVLNDTTTYTLLSIQSNCSQSLSGSIEIDVNPLPVMGPMSDLIVCPQDLVQIPAFTAVNGASFNWTNSNPSIGLAASGTGAIADFNAINTFPFSQTGVIQVIPELNGCSGTPVSFSLTVENLPVANAGTDQSVCIADGTFYSIGAYATPGESYSWSPATGLSDPTISSPVIAQIPAGTSQYILTVTSASGCTNYDTVTITGLEAPQVSLTASSLFLCNEGQVSFTADTSEVTQILWFLDGVFADWNTGEANLTTSFNSSGIHSVYVIATDASGCSSVDSIPGGIVVYPNVSASFTTGLNSNQIDSYTDHIDLINQSENATLYNWSFNGDWFSSETNPVVTFEPGNNFLTIQLVAENDFGCSDTAILHIEPLNDGVFYVPNTFTPNGDQFNNLFMPVVSDDFDLENYLFEIYNRWGELIFSTSEITEGWPGTYKGLNCKTDTYTWKLTLKSTKTELNRVIVGHVNLLR